jgi:hypothetical protein
VGDRHGIEQAVELARPEIEKFLQFGEIWVQVMLLPNVVLQDIGVVGHAVEDISGRQPKPFELAAEVDHGHAGSPDSQSTMVPFPTRSGNRSFRKSRAKSAC